MSSAIALNRTRLPIKTIMSFWRSRLNRLLRQDVLLRRIVVKGKRLVFETQSWEEYWRGAFSRAPATLRQLNEAWRVHRTNGFGRESGLVLGKAYMETVREAIQCKWPDDAKKRLLAMENAAICRADSAEPLAAMTVNFRNPLLLLRQADSDAYSHHSDTLLLPLVAAGRDETEAFFHYRRQSLLRNTNDAFLFFLRAKPSARSDSFCILQELVELLVHEWDSRIEQRSNLLADKVIAPLLPGLEKRGKSLKILDIGSGAGLFTSRLLKRICKNYDSGNSCFELAMLDQLPVEADRYFQERTLRDHIAGIEYICSDYADGIQQLAAKSIRQPAFDLTLILRILHNISEFSVTAANSDDDSIRDGRYTVDETVSDYFRLFSQVFPDMTNCESADSARERYWLPERKFNTKSLLLPNGKSLIEAITRISRVTIIEDADLRPEILDGHKTAFKLDDVIIHDLSRRLRLSTNHVYVLARKGMDDHLGGGTAWLN